jgi:prepilin-type N-terminal cleavage/methylation domain-containing protein
MFEHAQRSVLSARGDRPRAGLSGAAWAGVGTARRPGFTLIELLLVVAIIAVLVAIILPGLRGVRMQGIKTQSASNLRTIAMAGINYQSDNKSQLPVVPTGVPVPRVINAWITWGGWGKFTSTFWSSPGIFDILPSRRPLNRYLTSDPLPSTYSPDLRANFPMPMCKDPSDKIGYQQSWNAYEPTFGPLKPNPDFSTCYDDVGTSYLLQVKWFEQTAKLVGGNWTKAWTTGARRLSVADSFQPSRMIWINDQWCDITMNQVMGTAQIKNGYGDINMSLVGFLDGHVKYLRVLPGGENDPRAPTQPWLVPQYSNSDYTVVFPDLRPDSN